MPQGYEWTLREEDAGWRWIVRTRSGLRVVQEGVAGSRSEGAALLLRAIARNMAADELRFAAA